MKDLKPREAKWLAQEDHSYYVIESVLQHRKEVKVLTSNPLPAEGTEPLRVYLEAPLEKSEGPWRGVGA